MLAATGRFIDRFTAGQFRRRLAFEPFPFVHRLQVLDPQIEGYVDSGALVGNAGYWLGGFFIFMGLPIAVLGPLAARGADAIFVMAFGTASIGLGAAGIVASRRRKNMTRTLSHHAGRRQVEITLWRRGGGEVARTTASAAECRVLLHAISLCTSDNRPLPVGRGFALMMHVKDERFAIAAVKSKEEILDLWPKLPPWITAVDGGEGEKLELTSDRRVL